MTTGPRELVPIGFVESPLTDTSAAPKQGEEGSGEARVVVAAEFADAMLELEAGDDLIVLTWLHLGDRDTLRVHPRDDPANPLRGVFGTRSADRPNPVGLHRVRVLSVQDTTLTVSGLEAVDGTPVVDIKPALARGE